MTESRAKHLAEMVIKAQQLGVIDGWRAYLMSEFKALGLTKEQIEQVIQDVKGANGDKCNR